MSIRRSFIIKLGAAVSGILFNLPATALTRRNIQHTMQDKTWETFRMNDLMQQQAEEGNAYLKFLDRNTLSTGLYVLHRGATDPQQPHEQDEVYYILAGKAQFEVDGKITSANEGDILFVKAKIAHRFINIEEDLKILVFFSAAVAN